MSAATGLRQVAGAWACSLRSSFLTEAFRAGHHDALPAAARLHCGRAVVERRLVSVCFVAMETEWFIGTIRDDPPSERGEGYPTLDLAVQITEEEYLALSKAEGVIRETLRGVLFRLVFANHQALKDQEARILELLTRPDRRGLDWLPDQHLQTTLALATEIHW